MQAASGRVSNPKAGLPPDLTIFPCGRHTGNALWWVAPKTSVAAAIPSSGTTVALSPPQVRAAWEAPFSLDTINSYREPTKLSSYLHSVLYTSEKTSSMPHGQTSNYFRD